MGVLGALRFDDAVLGMGVLCERFWGEGELEYELQKNTSSSRSGRVSRVPGSDRLKRFSVKLRLVDEAHGIV